MKEKLTNNIVLKIISVIFAVVLWLIVLNINDPNKVVSISKIPVEIKNEAAILSQNKAYTIESGETAIITISGPRSIVDQLDAEDFIATADINDLSLTNAVPIDVELRKNTYKTKIDIKVHTVMKLNIEDVIEKEFDVIKEYVGELQPGYVLTETTLAKDKITITAPKSQMEKIKSVVAVIDVEGQNNDFSSVAKLKLLDIKNKEINVEEGSIKLSMSELETVSTVLFSKEVPVICDMPERINADNNIENYKISVDKITIAGRKAQLDAVESVELPINVRDLATDTEEIDITYNVGELLPEGVYDYKKIGEIVLTIYLDKQSNKSFEMSVSNISISNIPEGYEASFVSKGNINYTVRGSKDVLKNFEPDITSIHVSMEGLGAGKHSVKVEFALPDGITLLEDVYVEVNLKKQESETTEGSSENESSQENSSEEETTGGEEETSYQGSGEN